MPGSPRASTTRTPDACSQKVRVRWSIACSISSRTTTNKQRSWRDISTGRAIRNCFCGGRTRSDRRGGTRAPSEETDAFFEARVSRVAAGADISSGSLPRRGAAVRGRGQEGSLAGTERRTSRDLPAGVQSCTRPDRKKISRQWPSLRLRRCCGDLRSLCVGWLRGASTAADRISCGQGVCGGGAPRPDAGGAHALRWMIDKA